MKEYWKKHKKIISGVIIAIVCIIMVVTYHYRKNRIEDEIMYRNFEIAMEWFGHRNFRIFGHSSTPFWHTLSYFSQKNYYCNPSYY